MRKRLWLAAAMILVVVGIVASGLLVWLGQDTQGVSRANFERIRAGTSRADVELLLGDHWTERGILQSDDAAPFLVYWSEGPDEIFVEFDGNEKVREKK